MFSNEREAPSPSPPPPSVYSAALSTPTLLVVGVPSPAEKSFVHSIPERSSLLTNLIWWLIESCLFRAATISILPSLPLPSLAFNRTFFFSNPYTWYRAETRCYEYFLESFFFPEKCCSSLEWNKTIISPSITQIFEHEREKSSVFFQHRSQVLKNCLVRRATSR